MNHQRHTILIVLGLALMLALPATAQTGTCAGGDNYNCFLLRAPAALVPTIAAAHGLTVLEQLDANTPEVVLVSGPASQAPEITMGLVLADPDVVVFEDLEDVFITESLAGADLDQSYTTIVETIGKSGETIGELDDYFTTGVWNGYAEQPLADLVQLHAAHAYKDADKEDDAPFGWGTIAIIDTGVDPDHPLLVDALLPGYDFILEQAGASEWSALDPANNTQADFESVADQSYTTIVEGTGDPVFKNASAGVVVDQSYTTIVEGEPLPAAFGHGTMVAGIIRLVAPNAQLLPLRVFDGNGGANVFDIARAIHYAADNGAEVINMSFSTTKLSEELMRAVNYAHRKGVALVASVGNRGDNVLSYPAAFGNVVGVASTTDLDTMSAFSNFGSDMAYIAAPGEGFMTTYPGGLFAAGWGTSFATALVSGSVALLHHVKVKNNGQVETYCPSNFYKTAMALEKGAWEPLPSDAWGNGRVDLLESVKNKVKGGTGNC